MQKWGNKRANAHWEYHMPADYTKPNGNNSSLESFIRAKYERKKVQPRAPAAPKALVRALWGTAWSPGCATCCCLTARVHRCDCVCLVAVVSQGIRPAAVRRPDPEGRPRARRGGGG